MKRQHTRFSQAMVSWFQQNRFVSVVPLATERTIFEKGRDYAKVLWDHLLPLRILGKASKVGGSPPEIVHLANSIKDLAKVSGSLGPWVLEDLQPFIPLADLVGFRFRFQYITVIIVIYADTLVPETVLQRFEEFQRLSEPLGRYYDPRPQMGKGPPLILPLLVYFNEKRYAESSKTLLPKGLDWGLSKPAILRAGLVNVPARIVSWAEMGAFTKFYIFGLAYLTFTQRTRNVFSEQDLEEVLKKAGW